MVRFVPFVSWTSDCGVPGLSNYAVGHGLASVMKAELSRAPELNVPGGKTAMLRIAGKR